MPTVSLICTVRNEASNIAALLDSMLAQSRLPDEIVINDCQSTDETARIVREYMAREQRIRLVAGGQNISSGRNNAIAHASGDLIACTDAGLLLDSRWLEQIIAPLEQGSADQVGGFFQAAPRSLFEQALAATNYRHADEIDPARFLPFGKSMAFRKEVWAAVGGFPEWLDHCEDIVFDRAIAQAGYRRAFVPQALVYFRPRSSLRALARQYFFYARGDGRAGLWPLRHAIRYGTYATLAALLLAMGRWRATRCPGVLLLAAGTVAYTRQPYRRLWSQTGKLAPAARLYMLVLVPAVRLVGDCAKMSGYPVGIVARLRSSGTIGQ
jgi:glycosyltransferase involved in cell wall biosynthesis